SRIIRWVQKPCPKVGNGPGDTRKPSEERSIHGYRPDRIRRLIQKTQRNLIVTRTNLRPAQISIKNRYPGGSPSQRWAWPFCQKRFRCWSPRLAPSWPGFSFCKQGSSDRIDCRECPGLKRTIEDRLPHTLGLGLFQSWLPQLPRTLPKAGVPLTRRSANSH